MTGCCGLCNLYKTTQRRLLVLNTFGCAAAENNSKAALQALVAACLVVLANVMNLRCVMLGLLCKHGINSAMTG